MLALAKTVKVGESCTWELATWPMQLKATVCFPLVLRPELANSADPSRNSTGSSAY